MSGTHRDRTTAAATRVEALTPRPRHDAAKPVCANAVGRRNRLIELVEKLESYFIRVDQSGHEPVRT